MTVEHKAYEITGTADDQIFGVGTNRFHPLQKSTKMSKICENRMEKNGQGNVKQMNIGSLADESGLKRMTTPMGTYQGKFQGRLIAERVDALRMKHMYHVRPTTHRRYKL